MLWWATAILVVFHSKFSRFGFDQLLLLEGQGMH